MRQGDQTHLVETNDDAGPVAGSDGADVDLGVGEDGPLGRYPGPAQPVTDHRGAGEWTGVDVGVVHATVADVGLGGIGWTRCALAPCLGSGRVHAVDVVIIIIIIIIIIPTATLIIIIILDYSNQ